MQSFSEDWRLSQQPTDTCGFRLRENIYCSYNASKEEYYRKIKQTNNPEIYHFKRLIKTTEILVILVYIFSSYSRRCFCPVGYENYNVLATIADINVQKRIFALLYIEQGSVSHYNVKLSRKNMKLSRYFVMIFT